MVTATRPIYSDAQQQKEFTSTHKSVRERLLSPGRVLQNYKISQEQPLDLLAFLRKHPHIVSLLDEAVDQIRTVFGDVPVLLELDTDPEEGFQELFAVVVLRRTAEEALHLLEKFDTVWFEKADSETRGDLNFTVRISESGTV